MEYRSFGKTGVKVSALGFGAMRLPQFKKDGKWYIDEDKAISMIHYAFKKGVNYIDTAYGYCHGNSEIIVGKALKGWRDKVNVSTKMPTWKANKRGDYRRLLEEQLKKLDVEQIDFYHFHSLNNNNFKNIVLKYDLLKEAQKALDEGLIKHISFSFHDNADVLKKLIDVDIFETLLCQYNLLDRSLEEALKYADKKGVGVAIMGPVGGGRLASDSSLLKDAVNKDLKSTAELALRFVLANDNVSVALSGMQNMDMVKENIEIASQDDFFSTEELEQINRLIEQRRKKEEIPCTSCEYCLPCPNGVAIPKIFKFFNYNQVYGLLEYAKEQYASLNNDEKNEQAALCIECGKCEEMCPQNIEIIKELKRIHKELSG